MPRAKTTEAKKLPTHPGLPILYGVPFSADVQADIDAFHSDAAEWETHYTGLQASRRDLAENARDARLSDIIEHGRELDRQLHDSQDELVGLFYERFELLSRLEPDAARHAETTNAEYERVDHCRRRAFGIRR
jgi:hypothetical protein